MQNAALPRTAKKLYEGTETADRRLETKFCAKSNCGVRRMAEQAVTTHISGRKKSMGMISTLLLHTLPYFHLAPINLVVYQDPPREI